MSLAGEDFFSLIKPKASSLLVKVSHLLTKLKVEAYLVGGFVRDILMGRDTVDIDIAITADALEIAPKIATALGGKYVLLDEINRIGRVIVPNKAKNQHQWQLDFTTIKGGIEQDLAERDFTIDATAINLDRIMNKSRLTFKERESKVLVKPAELIDPFNGWNDLHRGVIRVVNESAFTSDAARLLRAVRLAVDLDFTIDKETEKLIWRYAHLIMKVAGERIREELLHILASPRSGQVLRYLDELGMLTAIIPELTQMKGISQPKEHYWDVFAHSIETVAAVDFLLQRGRWEYAGEEVLVVVPWGEDLARHFNRKVSHGSTRRSILKLAALLHDISKPQTKTIEEEGRMRFLGHAKEGALIAIDILKRMRFSSREVKLVEMIVKHHLRPMQMGQKEFPTSRAIYRYFRDTSDAGFDILFLSLADHLATRGPYLDLIQWREHTQIVEYILKQRLQEEGNVIPPKLVSGNDLIKHFGLSPGPRIGEVLEAVREAQAMGKIVTREEALAYVEHLLASYPSKS